MEPRNSHFLGFEAIMLCNCMNIYIYRIVASTNKKASPEKSCVICVQLPPESLAREDSCIYIYTILWLVVPFRPLYCCNMYYQHHHTQQQPVLNTACILRMHKNTSTKWGRVVWNYRISKSTRFSFFPSSNSLFTWRVGTNGSRVSLELRCQVRPGGSCLPQPTSRMWWSSPTPRRGPPFFSSSCALGRCGKMWFLGRSALLKHETDSFTQVVCHNVNPFARTITSGVIYGDITCWSVKYYRKL